MHTKSYSTTARSADYSVWVPMPDSSPSSEMPSNRRSSSFSRLSASSSISLSIASSRTLLPRPPPRLDVSLPRPREARSRRFRLEISSFASPASPPSTTPAGPDMARGGVSTREEVDVVGRWWGEVDAVRPM